MSQPALAGALPEAESFLAVVIRRSRYVLAVVLSALLFSTAGWLVAAPPAEYGGISLTIWGTGAGMLAGFLLALMLIAAAAVCSLLVHPDNPHMGLSCALLGMAGLSIRGGTIYSIIRIGQAGPDQYHAMARMLGLECIQWGVIFVMAEVVTRAVHDRFFANHHWIIRHGTVAEEFVQGSKPGHAVVGLSHSMSKSLGTGALPRPVAAPLAMVVTALLSAVLLYCLMQSQVKGQVLMACFVAFYGAALGGYLAFPRVPAIAFLATVPLVAAGGYFYGSTLEGWPLGHVGFYPGQAHFFMMRALPLDYVVAGVPGAILGYYHAYHLSLNSHDPGA